MIVINLHSSSVLESLTPAYFFSQLLIDIYLYIHQKNTKEGRHFSISNFRNSKSDLLLVIKMFLKYNESHSIIIMEKLNKEISDMYQELMAESNEGKERSWILFEYS